MSRFYTDFKSQAYETIDAWTQMIQEELETYDKTNMEKKAEKALDILEELSQKYVPEDTKALRNSWFRRVEVKDGTVELVFGYDEDNQLDYAWFVYINPLGNVFKKPGARDKWLEHALDEALPKMLDVLYGS